MSPRWTVDTLPLSPCWTCPYFGHPPSLRLYVGHVTMFDTPPSSVPMLDIALSNILYNTRQQVAEDGNAHYISVLGTVVILFERHEEK